MAVFDNRGTITANRPLVIDKEDAAHVNSGIIGGSNITISGLNSTFSNSGAVTVSPGRTLTTPTFMQTGGMTTVDGSLRPATMQLELSGGRLGGSGSVFASVTNTGGIVAPGSSTGRLRVLGAYDQEVGGTLEIEIGGPTAVSEFDVLSVSGGATLDGTLELSIINSFEPMEMETFQTLSATSVTGFFSTVNGRSAPNNLELTPIYNANDVTINVAQPLRLNGLVGTGGAAMTLDDVGVLRQAAISLWIDAGISQEVARRLNRVDFRIVDLSGDLLGLSYDNVILLDADAAGLGWFVDASPDTSDDLADGRIDLLTAIAHELGHTLGLADNVDPLATGIMAARLAAAERRTPSASEADAVMERIGSH